MKASKLLLILGALCLTSFVGSATNESTIAKPPKENKVFVIEQAEYSIVEMSFNYTNDLLAGEILSVDINLVASPYNPNPIGEPNTKYHAKHLFHPLKLC